MSKTASLLVALVLLACGFALGHYATPTPSPQQQTPIPPRKNPFPPKRPQTRIPEPILQPSPTRDPVMKQVLDALREPDAFARVTRLAALLPGLDPDAIPEIHATLDDYALDLGPPEIDLLLRFWAASDPTGAALWAALKAPRPYREVAVMAVIETWAAVDPGSAYEHLATMSMVSSESSRAGEIALVRGWFQSGLPGLEDFLQSLGVGEQRQRAIGVYARKTIQRDGSAAIVRWAESIPGDDKALKLDVNRHVAKELAKVEPAVAVAFCEAHCDGPFGTSMRMFIAQNWADRDGRAAMQWVRTEPAGPERVWAVKGAFRGWTRSDPEGFLKWLEAMGVEGVEPWFEPVLEVLPKWLVGRDPAAAIEWATAIRDPEKRERALVLVARRWLGIDAGAATAWLEGSPLSEAARAQVLDPNPPKSDGQANPPQQAVPPSAEPPAG